MPNYPYDELDAKIDRAFVQGLNKNFDDIEQDLSGFIEPLGAILDEAFDNVVLISNFEARALEKLEEIQPEFYKFQQEAMAELARNQIELRGVYKNVLFHGAVNDYIDTENRGTDNTAFLNQLLAKKGIVIFPDGDYYTEGDLIAKSNTKIIFSPNSRIYTNAQKAIYFAPGVENVTILNPKMISLNRTDEETTPFYFDGASDSYATNVKDIRIISPYTQGFTNSGHLECLRKSLIDAYHAYNDNGFFYGGKSAEVVIRDSNIVKNTTTSAIENSRGLVSKAVGEDYPEGLTVINTLFYQFEKNLEIDDLYVGNFTNLYLDGSAEGCLESTIDRDVRTNLVTLDNPWILGKGIKIGKDDSSTAPKELRVKIVNPRLDSITGDIGIEIKKWMHDIDIIDPYITGTSTNKPIGIVSNGQNNFVKVSGYKGKYMASNIQMKGEGQFNELSDISNNDGLSNELHVNLEYPVKYDGTSSNGGRYSNGVVSKNYQPSSEIAAITKAGTKTMLLEGTYLLRLNLNKISIANKGYIRFTGNADAYPYYKAVCRIASDNAAQYLVENDNRIDFSTIVQVTKSGYFDFFAFGNETLNITVSDYFNVLELVKL